MAKRSILSDKMYNTVTGYDFTRQAPLAPRRAIRAKCYECQGSASEITICTITDCALWPWRCRNAAEGLDIDDTGTDDTEKPKRPVPAGLARYRKMKGETSEHN